jgi:hypothetical protein
MLLGALWGVTSLEIQEVGEGSCAGLLPELAEDDARITDIMRSTCAAAYEVDALDDEAEEDVTCSHLEQGLRWARCVFDELILLVTTVNPHNPGT